MLSRCTPPVLALLAVSAAVASTEGLSRLVSYTSSLDNSTQQYGVYLPLAPAPSAAGYPAVLHMHGYGWSVGSGFSDFQKQWAERYGWILINLNARGPQFYEGVGDVESRNVIRDAVARFGVDRSRIFVTGGSMGGTGAFRVGIRYPDLIAATVGVDGWSDFREWHRHWYARTDQREAIEEFRRPLLEACSPLYWAGRARWGQVQASVSGQDSVVLPENGLLLYNALLQRATDMPGAYDSRLFLDYDKRHGGSFRIDQIYEYFLSRATLAEPGSFLCESTVLTHGNLYWGSLERLKVQGAFASLESDAEGNVLSAVTRNLSGFALHLQASPVADQATVTVYADGFLCYQGPPRTVHLQADWSPTGQLWGWHEWQPSGLRKTPALEGALGEAFKVPFVVCYGTAGSEAETQRNRREAEAFVRGWNDFMVHEQALRALPEEQVSAPEVATRSLVIYGTEGSSRLLHEANARRELPVHVRSDRILVRDPRFGDREYLGPQFGAFLCYPNPLTEDTTYLVVCRGQWATKPDGTKCQGLEYDLEKLPWAYPDYVVFNTDQSQLPHVLNVNDKPPVTCYEAGYFVEAGYFDQDWQPYRLATLDRVNATQPATRRYSVASVTAGESGVTVKVLDTSGAPVNTARVTVRFEDTPPLVCSGLTGPEGTVFFPFATPAGMTPPSCSVVNVMATGAEYDFTADAAASTAERGLTLTASATGVDENGRARITVQAAAAALTNAAVTVEAPAGTLLPPCQTGLLGPQPRSFSFQWEGGQLAPGPYRPQVRLRASKPAVIVTRTLQLQVGDWTQTPLRLTELKTTDVTYGQPWQVSAKVLNTGDSTVLATLHCALLEARRYGQPQRVPLRPGEERQFTFGPTATETPLARGMHTARVWAAGARGTTATADLGVK